MPAWPFEGREVELSKIQAAFLDRGIGAVLLVAPLGAGATRLARQSLSDLTGAAGMAAVWIAATRAAVAIPFGAIAALMPHGATTTSPPEVMGAVADHVGGWGGRRKVVIVVDDAHLLDDASSTVIAHLITSRLAFVIMTLRAGEPLADVLVRLCGDGQALRIPILSLPEPVMDKLIDHAAVDRLTARGRQRLRDEARGNPLALRELLHGAEPGGLTELVTSRLQRLAPRVRYAVELVAHGEPLEVSILERLVGVTSLVAAEDSGLVVVERAGARLLARLDHPLYGEALRAEMRLSRALRVHRALAGALLATPLRRRDDVLRAALWQVEGAAVRQPEVVRAGAWQAVGYADLGLAERLARAARAASPGQASDMVLAEVLTYRGRTQEAEQVLPTTPPEEPDDRVAWAIARSSIVYWGGGDADAAHAALDVTAGHPATEASRSWVQFFDADCTAARRLSRTVLDNPDAEPRAVIWAAAAGGAACGFLGRLDEAHAMHRRGAAVAAAHVGSVPWGVVEVDTGLCLGLLAGGEPAAAQSIASAGYQQTLDDGAEMMVSGWALFGGVIALARGHLDDADRLLAEAGTGFAANDTFRLIRCCLAARAGVLGLRGDPSASALLGRADALDHRSNRIFAPWIESWRIWVAYAEGDLAAAAAAATAAADLARAAAAPAVEALALYDVARLGARPDLARLEAIDHDLARLLAAAARGLTARDGASRLEAAARALQVRGYDLHAAEAFAIAAQQHHCQGRRVRAGLAQANAARLRRDLSDARTPQLRPGHLTSLLTAREREVVLLAAEHTSAQVAQRLGLAVPTVNNNLARAYAKLGITGRGQLRDLLASDGGR